MSTSFRIAEFQARISNSLDNLTQFLQGRSDSSIQTLAQDLAQKRQSHAARPLLSLAFSGQYSAGKSTIISALTGDESIRISADVATDEVGTYKWRGIELWDTPGLFADRPDHDARAQQALRDADLVVYCLTTNLFDEVTSRDFRTLAFEQGYARKLFLVVNKLSMEDTDDVEVLIRSLTLSINQTLAPHHLDEFQHAFIDAQDYRDGRKLQNTELIAFSRFEQFTDRLNHWTEERGLLARLDPPIRAGLNAIDQALACLPQQSFEDNPDLFLVNQQLRIVQNQRLRTDEDVQRLCSDNHRRVQILGERLIAGDLGESQEAFDNALTELNREAYDRLNKIIQDSYNRLLTQLEEFAQQDFVADYYATVNAQGTVKPDQESTAKGGSGFLGGLKGFAKQLHKHAAGPGAAKAGFLLGAKQVAGGGLHQVIYQGGKMLGVKFKPWGAVNAAKNLGNVMGVAAIGLEIYSCIQEHQQEQEMETNRQAQLVIFRDDVDQIGRTLADQLEDIYRRQYDADQPAAIYQRLCEVRDELLSQQADNRAFVAQLKQYQTELNSVLSDLYGSEAAS